MTIIITIFFFDKDNFADDDENSNLMAPSGLGGCWQLRGGVTPFKLHNDDDGDDGGDGDGDERAVQASVLRCHCQLSAASWSRLPQAAFAFQQVSTPAA